MKRKIIISFLLFFLLFIAGIGTTLHIINKTTANLTALLLLHKVEVIRQDLVINVQTVQSNLYTTGTSFGKEMDIIVDNVLKLRDRAQTCTDCHHEPSVEKEIHHLQELTEQYKEAISYFITSTADAQRIRRLQGFAADIGDRIIKKSQWMASTANDALREKTIAAMQEVSNSKRILIGTIAFSFLVGVFVSLAFIKSITIPIAELLNATRKIQAGELQFRIEAKLKDEFGELATAFNEMAASLKKQCLRLQHTERLAVIGELAAGLAHEVRNPLTGIKVSIEVMASELDLEPEDKKVFSRIIDEIKRIETLLKSMLNYARPPQPQPMTLELQSLIETTIRNAQFVLKKPDAGSHSVKNIQFIKEFAPDLPQISADPSQLQQIFLNLFLNAFDAIESDGKITVKTEIIDDESIKVSISDNGKGMDSQAIDKIFLPFYSCKPKGTGLGLSICKRLVEQHDGTIAATNNPDGGLTFSITLPALKKQAEEHEPA